MKSGKHRLIHLVSQPFARLYILKQWHTPLLFRLYCIVLYCFVWTRESDMYCCITVRAKKFPRLCSLGPTPPTFSTQDSCNIRMESI